MSAMKKVMQIKTRTCLNKKQRLVGGTLSRLVKSKPHENCHEMFKGERHTNTQTDKTCRFFGKKDTKNNTGLIQITDMFE